MNDMNDRDFYRAAHQAFAKQADAAEPADKARYKELGEEAWRRMLDCPRPLVQPLIFKMDLSYSAWLVGVGDQARSVPGSEKGLLPAWTALARGFADLAEFTFDDEKTPATSIRNSIKGACASWAKNKAGCPELAFVFEHRLRVEGGRIIYTSRPGDRAIDTGAG